MSRQPAPSGSFPSNTTTTLPSRAITVMRVPSRHSPAPAPPFLAVKGELGPAIRPQDVAGGHHDSELEAVQPGVGPPVRRSYRDTKQQPIKNTVHSPLSGASQPCNQPPSP